MLFSPLLPLSSLPHSIPTLSLIFLSWNHTQCSHQAALYSTHSPVTIQVVCFFDFKLHSWHEIHQGEGVQKLYVCRVVLSLRLFPILRNSSLLLYCCCYFCCIYVSSYNYYHYWNLKEGEIKRRLLKKRDRDYLTIRGLERQFLGNTLQSCPTYNPSVWHPTRSQSIKGDPRHPQAGPINKLLRSEI